jgi:hypothetical protein
MKKERIYMGLFGKKNKNEKHASCCCGGNCDCNSMANAEKAKGEGASVKVLGAAAQNATSLKRRRKPRWNNWAWTTTIEHVTDFAQIAAYGVMTTPALVVDGKVVSYGKVLKTEEVVAILQRARVITHAGGGVNAQRKVEGILEKGPAYNPPYTPDPCGICRKRVHTAIICAI